MAKLNYISQNSIDSQQSVPNYLISFIPFAYRNTYYKQDDQKSFYELATATKDSILVVNDAVSINITYGKGSHLGGAEIQLISGDVNYSSAIAPGDHAFIWLFDNKIDWERITKYCANLKEAPKDGTSLNDFNSGLKFVGRVQSVRQTLVTNARGAKTYRYHVVLGAFTELDSQVYFNEHLSPDSLKQSGQSAANLEFFTNISQQFLKMFSDQTKNRLSIEDVCNNIINIFMGSGPENLDINGTPRTPNAAFLVPARVATYLGLSPFNKEKGSLGIKYSDILHRIFGLQKYNFTDSLFPDNAKGQTNKSVIFQCDKRLKGNLITRLGNFNNVSLMSLLHEYSNPTLNEIYTCLKFIPSKGIMPTLVLRQIPFSTDKITQKEKNIGADDVTLFSSLNRWKIDPSFPVFEYNLGSSDAERFNFILTYVNVQTETNPETNFKVQIANGNSRIDNADIVRSGPRIHTTISEMDVNTSGLNAKDPYDSNKWAGIIADFFVNGHLKMNGTIVLAGIQKPICVGDNIEFDNKLFHVEGVSHSMIVDPSTGKKTFRTVLHISHGYYISNGQLKYMCEMSSQREGQKDILLPGYTDEERWIGDRPITSYVEGKNKKDTNAKQGLEQGGKTRIQDLKNKIKGKI